jgi:hypothetical protein
MAPEVYDLLVLADGPWTEARLRTADARIIQARHWIEFFKLLKDGATMDLDHFEEEIEDAGRSVKAKTPAQQDALNRYRLQRAHKRLLALRKQRTEFRAALFLDDEDPE